MEWKIGGFGELMPLCLTCRHSITLYSDNPNQFFIQDCWCGGYLIDRDLIRDIIYKEKSLWKSFYYFGLNGKLERDKEQQMINYAITKQLLDENLQLRVYFNRDKKIHNPFKFLMKIVDYVLAP